MKLFTKLLKVLGLKGNILNNRIITYLQQSRQLNAHLVDYQPANELQKQYVQFLPDKYAANLQLYRQVTSDFFDYNDVGKWTAGFFENNAGDLTRFFGLNLCIDQLPVSLPAG